MRCIDTRNALVPRRLCARIPAVSCTSTRVEESWPRCFSFAGYGPANADSKTARRPTVKPALRAVRFRAGRPIRDQFCCQRLPAGGYARSASYSPDLRAVRQAGYPSVAPTALVGPPRSLRHPLWERGGLHSPTKRRRRSHIERFSMCLFPPDWVRPL